MKIVFKNKHKHRFNLIVFFNYDKQKFNKENESYICYLCFC